MTWLPSVRKRWTPACSARWPNSCQGSPGTPLQSAVQPLCLGANVARGFPLREAVLASYAALTLQTATIDDRDPAGIMNREAALWWQANAARAPLSRAPFLAGVAEEDES